MIKHPTKRNQFAIKSEICNWQQYHGYEISFDLKTFSWERSLKHYKIKFSYLNSPHSSVRYVLRQLLTLNDSSIYSFNVSRGSYDFPTAFVACWNITDIYDTILRLDYTREHYYQREYWSSIKTIVVRLLWIWIQNDGNLALIRRRSVHEYWWDEIIDHEL